MIESGFLPVSGGHTIYYEVHGKGRPAVVLHGGPGGGLNHMHLKMFDLSQWRVLLFDQRGCGKSTPFGEIEHNTTWDLVEDMEVLRRHLGWEKWFIQGGSWGTTLALAYAITHPSRVTGLLLRGACLSDDASFAWLYQKGGASEIFPDSWANFIAVLPERLHLANWKTIAQYYHARLNSKNAKEAQRYAHAWWTWESDVSQLLPVKDDTSAKDCLSIARLENHYFVNGCWLKKDQLLKGLSKLRHIPITIVHGRYDLVCPMSGPMKIKAISPHTRLIIVPDAGHATVEPGTMLALRSALRSALRGIRSIYKTRKARSRRKE
jgi:proline iminopeptidase